MRKVEQIVQTVAQGANKNCSSHQQTVLTNINVVTKRQRPLEWVQVKEAMVDDAQASIANLKAQLSAAQAEAAESAQALRHAEADLTEHEAEEQRQHQSLRYNTRCLLCSIITTYHIMTVLVKPNKRKTEMMTLSKSEHREA